MDYEEILTRLDEAVTHLRHLSRTLHEATYSEGAWDERLRTRWAAIVKDAGLAIADPHVDLDPIHERLVVLTRDMSESADLPRDSWPVYGSLLTSMFHIAALVDGVASAYSARSTGVGAAD